MAGGPARDAGPVRRAGRGLPPPWDAAPPADGVGCPGARSGRRRGRTVGSAQRGSFRRPGARSGRGRPRRPAVPASRPGDGGHADEPRSGGGVLSERATKLGVEIRRGVTVSGVAQEDDHVVAYAGEEAYAARRLVGCYGGRSAVRGLTGFEFTGTEPLFHGLRHARHARRSRRTEPGDPPDADGHVHPDGRRRAHRRDGLRRRRVRPLAAADARAISRRCCAACPAPT